MRKILLATTLLSIAVSENILMENHPKMKTAWLCDKQLWNRKAKRIPRKDIPSKIEESLNYDYSRQFPRISDTQFLSEPRKLPIAFRRHDLARFSQVDLSSDKSKFDSTKPRVLISIGIQEEKNAGNDLQEDWSIRKNYRKHNQGMQVQQPFYVEEPRWIDIDADYIESQRENSDPYILTRGKKIFRIKDPEQVGKTIEDYETIFDYPSKNKGLLIKSRVRRSVKTNEEFQDETTDEKNNQMKERSHYDSLQDMDRDLNNTAITEIENRSEKTSEIDTLSEDEIIKDANHDIFIENYKKNDLNNVAKKFRLTKENQISANGMITKFVEEKQEIQHEDVSNDVENGSSKTAKIDQVEKYKNKSHFVINKRLKRSVLPKNQELHETYENDTSFKKDVEKNGTYEQMRNIKAYIDKLNVPGTSDLLTLSPGKDSLNDGIDSLNKKDTDKSVERIWKLHDINRKKLKNEREMENDEDGFEINKDYTGMADSQLTSEFNSNNFETKSSNYREKRNVCKTCKLVKLQLQQDEWLKDIEKKLQESLSLERRDKHSDILERLGEPYIISRGKKAPQDLGKSDLSTMFNSQNMNNDEDHTKMMTLPFTESILKMLLMEISRCNDNCDIIANRLFDERLSPRDRRGTLDEILAASDPFYVARGKRMTRNQKGAISFETDARQ